MVRRILLAVIPVVLVGCASPHEPYSVPRSKMETSQPETVEQQASSDNTATQDASGQRLKSLEPLVVERVLREQRQDASSRFSDNDKQTASANNLPIAEFVQTVFSEVLDVNYIITDKAKNNSAKVSLNLKEPVSSRRLYQLARELLQNNELDVNYRDNIFYVTPKSSEDGDAPVIGLGRNAYDVPDTLGQVLQIIPLKYGITISIERTLRDLVNAQITPDTDQGALFVRGSRQQILRVIDLVNLLDVPSHRGKYVALLELTYLGPEDFIEKLTELLEAEGINASDQASGNDALVLVPIQQVGAVAMFAGDQSIIDRAEYWAKQVDRAQKGVEKQYYVYTPKYARASDLGESVAPLIGGAVESAGGNQQRDTQSSQQQLVQGSQPRSSRRSAQQSSGGSISVQSEDMKMTVDERSNSLIFYTTGANYQALLPIIQRLDLMPKQILLDATIAEVTLTDEFEQGFEFAFRNGKFSGGTLGALGVDGISGFQLNWADGLDQVIGKLSASTSLVNVLSNPTLVVRDGVAASISVGNDIPTIGATTSNPIESDRQTTVVNYRKTGVNLTVTPTINAQGLVLLEIDQEISSTTETGPTVSGSPSIFERSIQTEVLAQSGQTILLGGLISENKTKSDTNVPGLSKIPLLGNLFQSKSDSTEKTELVIFITPRVIDSVDDWTEIRARIAEGLTNLKLAN